MVELDTESHLQNIPVFAAIFLALFTIISFTTNIFVIVTIASSYRLRNAVVNYFILNIAVANLCDATINMVLTLLYVCFTTWSLGNFLCKLNSFYVQIVSVETLVGLALLCVDRAVALLSIHRYKHRMSYLRAIVAIGGAWLIGCCFGFPILISSVPSKPLPARYFCSVATIVGIQTTGAELVHSYVELGYPVSVLLACYFIPLLIILLSFAVIFNRARLDRVGRRTILPDFRNTNYIVDTRKFQQQLSLGKFSVALFIIFLCLHGPYTILHYIIQIRNSRQLYGPKEFSIDFNIETAITWIKFLFPVIYPLVVAACCSDIWTKFIDLICCRKTTVARTTTVDGQDAPDIDAQDDSGVPVLVATSGGLHLRTTEYDAANNKETDRYSYADLREISSKNPLRMHKNSDETSDYDSDEYDSDSEIPPNDIPGVSTARGTFGRTLHQAYEIVHGNVRKTKLDGSYVPVNHAQSLSGNSQAKERDVATSTQENILNELAMARDKEIILKPGNLSLDERKIIENLGRSPTPQSTHHRRTPSEGQTSVRSSQNFEYLDQGKSLAKSLDEKALRKEKEIWDARKALEMQQNENLSADSRPGTSKPASSSTSQSSSRVPTTETLLHIPEESPVTDIASTSNNAAQKGSRKDTNAVPKPRAAKRARKVDTADPVLANNRKPSDKPRNLFLPPINMPQQKQFTGISSGRLKFAESRKATEDTGTGAPVKLPTMRSLKSQIVDGNPQYKQMEPALSVDSNSGEQHVVQDEKQKRAKRRKRRAKQKAAMGSVAIHGAEEQVHVATDK